MPKRTLNNNRGVSLVLMGLSIAVLFGFGALAIDVSHLYNVKNQLQAAADAAALAGAAKLGDEDDFTQTGARDEAQRIAALNFADVAYVPVPALGYAQGANPGEKIPVALDLNTGNADTGDIVVGNWDNNTFTANLEPANAVMVVARRAGTIPAQPRASNWFAKVFALLPWGANFDFTGIVATAIAANDADAILTPIIVNEYWRESAPPPPQVPYGLANQYYPRSFVRRFNVRDNSDGGSDRESTLNPLWGKTFAILGAEASDNVTPAQDMNSFVDLDWRTDTHGLSMASNWYRVSGPNLSDITPMTMPSTGDINSESTTHGEVYFFEPYPNAFPTAVREVFTSSYSGTNYPNPASYTPFATLPFFSGAGTDVIGELRDDERYQPGKKIGVLVYDGTFVAGGGGASSLDIPLSSMLAALFSPSEAYAAKPPDTPGGGGGDGGGGGGGGGGGSTSSIPSHATCVGFVVIQIDGYASSSPSDGTLEAPGLPPYNNLSGNTMYGHAVTDIFEPAPGEQLTEAEIKEFLKKNLGGGSVRLVGTTGVRYGLAH